MIALGCEKNRIDGEIMLSHVVSAGYELCAELEECDAVIVHTCTFIDPAKSESIDAVLDAARYKETGSLKKIIVTGCLAERYREQILELLPEADAVLGTKSYDRIVEALRADSGFQDYRPLSERAPEGERIVTSSNYSVYVKIAEGCSNHCTYCVIPSVRGEFQPRDREDVLEEVKRLVLDGAREINLIAQDTTAYPELCGLIKDICALKKVKWVRILYCRPEEITEELLELMAAEEKLVSYIDVPLQHASGRILKLMNRTGDDKQLSALMEHIREKVSGVSLRTTFITGFPKESEEDFEILCDFISRVRFDNLGVFTYSREEGTPAARMRGQIDEETKRRRADTVMSVQLNILDVINKKYVGKEYEVLCEGKDESGRNVGRAYFQAPDIDGRVYFTSSEEVREGEFVTVKILGCEGYDLFGEVV